MIRASAVLFGVAAVLLLTSEPGHGSLYQPEEPMIVPVREDGRAEAFPFDEFRRRLAVLANIASPAVKEKDGHNRDREKVLARVKAAKEIRKPTPDQTAALAADLLRLGNTDAGYFVDEALDLLTPRTRDRVPHYFIHTTLAEVHAARGEWADAVNYQHAALFDCTMPENVKGWTRGQRDWVARIDRDYVPHYLRIRKAEAEARPRPPVEIEEPTPLFPLPEKGKPAEPVRFVNDAGKYEPGVLAAAEREKLPSDAVAIVQQLLLWFPADTRLYWLLAELYAAEGKPDVAHGIMLECTSWSRQYGNRKLLVEHQAAIAALPRTAPTDEAVTLPPSDAPAPADNAQDVPINMGMVWVYFAVVVGVGLLAAVRVLLRRVRR